MWDAEGASLHCREGGAALRDGITAPASCGCPPHHHRLVPQLRCCRPLLLWPALLCCAVLCCAVQLRIGAVIRRDGAPDNPNFPGAPALPCSAVGAQALEIAKGERSDEIIRIA